jgi:hypothetical protein
MTSPAHRAALGFLKGGLIAVVSIVIAPELGPLATAFPLLGWLVRVVQFLLPLVGFAFGGAIGADALGFGSRTTLAFGYGGGATGLVLRLAAPNLQRLTGFEDPFLVVTYGVVSAAVAFGATGVIGSLTARRGKVGRVTAGFVVGGAIGGFIGVAPYLAQRWHAGWPLDLWSFVSFACSIAAVAVPLVIGGSIAARNWS